jgi:hypothetical protein
MARPKRHLKPSKRVQDIAAQSNTARTSNTPALIDEPAPTNGTESQEQDEFEESQVSESAPTQTGTQVGGRPGAYAWTGPAHLFLISQLKAAIREGERAENGFHRRIWDRIAARFPDEGLPPVTRAQVKNKHDSVCPV